MGGGKVAKILGAKGGIKHNCKVLLRQVVIQEGISASSMLLPSPETGEQRLPRALPFIPRLPPSSCVARALRKGVLEWRSALIWGMSGKPSVT